MGEFHKYPHIDGLHKVPEIFSAEEIVAAEKIHGTNFRVMVPADFKDGGLIRFGSRNNEVGLGGGFYGDKPIRWFLDRPNLLSALQIAADAIFQDEDVIIYGEIYGAGIQGGVQYVTSDEVQFRAFDVCAGDRMVDYQEFESFCVLAGLPTVPVVYRGKPTVAALNALLEVNSVVAQSNGVTLEKNIAEGVVIRPTKMRKNHHDQWILAKHKSVGFAEDHQGRRGPVHPRSYAPVLGLAERFVTRGRLLNALDKAKEAGKPIQNSMADMQVLPAIVFDDIALDIGLKPEINNEGRLGVSYDLSQEERFADPKALRSAITRQTAIVYKALLDEQIGVAAE